MIDLAGKTIITENEVESERILRMAVAQGYTLPKGLKALTVERNFRFIGSPYKSIVFPSDENCGFGIRYVDIFGDEEEELQRIINSASHWCMAHGYPHVSISVNDEENAYSAKAYVSSTCGAVKSLSSQLAKPRKVSMEEVERMFGYPVEIV